MLRQRKIFQSTPVPRQSRRVKILQLGIYFAMLGIVGRLFYWQIIKSPQLQAIAEAQYRSTTSLNSHRGKIYTSEGHLLVGNTTVYTLFGQPQFFKKSPAELAQILAPILFDPATVSTQSASLADLQLNIQGALSQPDKKWLAISHRVTADQKAQIQELKLPGIGFDPVEIRSYPEASMAAHLTGFVGRNEAGEPTGYFGLEGQLDLELKGKTGQIQQEKDAVGTPIFLGESQKVAAEDGRDLYLTIRRDLQFLLEEKLQDGIEKYGALAGEAVLADPQTGRILAMASFPRYEQARFSQYPAQMYRNPLAAEAYEPGSTFKVLTVSAGIDTGVITPDTPCDFCSAARKISGFTIKTWNDAYNPGITMKDGLAKSDNTAMIFIAEKLGTDRFKEYLQKFQIGEATGVELQEDTKTPIRDKWRLIDLATASFGQGIATTGLQMVKAVGAVANDGKMMKPHVVEAVVVDGKKVEIQPEVVGQPISKQTADTVTEMMIHAAHQGEAKWAVLKDYTIAGKTGTAQIPVAGHYDAEKTIASFIGFAPAHDPKFIMLIKLREPLSSQWASETAAPLWYDIAEDLFIRMNIAPDRK